MTIRRMLFLLFLYTLLVWLVVIYLFRDAGWETILQKGLLWTAFGVGALMAWLFLERLVNWWQLRRARRKLQPAPEARSERPVHEDDTALSSLIAEADDRLARAAGAPRRRVRDLPIYLLIGQEGAGKTSVLHNAGIDAQLLAGQVQGGRSPVAGSRVGNIWLANDCIFLEISGRIFGNDTARFESFLKVIKPQTEAKGWRIWKPAAQRLQLRGVILCCDLRGFIGTPDDARLDQAAQTTRERLLAVTNTFGVACPVYALFTKTDAVPYFTEFFDKLPEAEVNQPFGVLASLEGAEGKIEDRVWADAETKRLNRDFNKLFLCLNARRLLTLSHEHRSKRKPAIYEFPREFKRVRARLVQFLVDSFRPDPLRLSPALRGFFFVATRLAERQAEGALEKTQAGTRGDRSPLEATRIFKPDATILGQASLVIGSQPQGLLVEKWIFVKDLFQEVLQRDRPPVSTVSLTDPKIEQYRMVAVGVATGIAVLLSLLWTISWLGNRSLVSDIQQNIALSGRRPLDLSFESLQALESLRTLLVERLDKPRELHLNWGLYTGNTLREGVRAAYFDRLRLLVLDEANKHLADKLRTVGAAGSQEPYKAVYGQLQTHLTITASACPVDAVLVGTTIKNATVRGSPGS